MVDWKALGLLGAAAAVGWFLLGKKSDLPTQDNASGVGSSGSSTADANISSNISTAPTPKATGVEMNYLKSDGGAYQWQPGTYTAPSGAASTVTNVTDTPSNLRQGWQIVSHPGGKDTYVFNNGKVSYNYTKDQYDAYIKKASSQMSKSGVIDHKGGGYVSTDNASKKAAYKATHGYAPRTTSERKEAGMI